MARPHRRNIPQIVTSNSAFGLGDVEQVEHIVRVPVVENEALEARADSSASLRDADNLATVDDCLAGTDRTEADQPTPSRALQRPSMHGGVDTEAAERTCPCLAEPMAGQAVVAPATVGSRQQDVEPEAPPVRDQHGSPTAAPSHDIDTRRRGDLQGSRLGLLRAAQHQGTARRFERPDLGLGQRVWDRQFLQVSDQPGPTLNTHSADCVVNPTTAAIAAVGRDHVGCFAWAPSRSLIDRNRVG
jgi:hypothetical protein